MCVYESQVNNCIVRSYRVKQEHVSAEWKAREILPPTNKSDISVRSQHIIHGFISSYLSLFSDSFSELQF